MKQAYEPPVAEVMEFNREDVIAVSDIYQRGDRGHGFGNGGGCDHEPGHGNPNKPHPNRDY